MVRTPWLLATLLFASLMVFLIMGPLEVLLPFLIKDKLGGGPGDHALVLAAFGIGGAVGSMVDGLAADAAALPDLDEPDVGRRLPAVRGDGDRHRDLDAGRRGASSLGVFFSAPMVIWGTLLQRRVPPAPARPGRLARLLRVDQPDADLDGRGRPGVRGDRPAHDVPHRRHRARPCAAVVAIVAAKLPQDEIAHPL